MAFFLDRQVRENVGVACWVVGLVLVPELERVEVVCEVCSMVRWALEW